MKFEDSIIGFLKADFVPLLSFGLHVPNFSAFLTLLVVAWFSFVIIKFRFVEIRSKRRELRDAIQFLQQVLPPVHTIDYATLPKVDEFFKGRKLFANSWREFSETFISDPETENPRGVYNTRPAAEFFGRRDIVETGINFDFHRAFPGIITGIGLGITFLAILVGLNGLVDPGADRISQGGVTNLVKNLSGKFISSIAAIVLATIYVLCEKKLFSLVEHDYQEFLNALDNRFARRSSEELLNRLLVSAREQESALRCFNSDLSGIMKESMSKGISEGLGPLFASLKDSVDRLVSERNSSMKEGLGGLAAEVSTAISRATGGELGALVASMKETVSSINGLNEQTRQSQSATQAMVQQLDEYLRRQSDAGTEQIERVGRAMEAISERLEKSAESSGRSLEERVQKVLERLEATTSLVLEENKKQTDHLNELLRASGENFQGALQRAGLQMQQTLEQSTRSMFERLDRFGPMMEAISERLEKSAETSGRSVEERVQRVLERLEATSALVLEENRKQTEQLSGIFRTATESFQGTLQSAGTQMQESLGSSSRVMFERLDGVMSALQTSSSQMSEDTKRQSDRLGTLTAEMTSSLEESFKGVAQNLQDLVGGLLARSASYTEEASSQFRSMIESQERSTARLDEARGTLVSALGTFKETVAASSQSQGQFAKLVTEMRQISTSVEEGIRKLRAAQDDVVTLTTKTRESAEDLVGGAKSLSGAVESNIEMITLYDQLLKQVDKSLGQMLVQIDERTEKYNAAMGESLGQSLQLLDRHLGRATQSLGGAIDDLTDNLERITEITGRR